MLMRSIVPIVIIYFLFTAAGLGEDLLRKYGTRSDEAAKQIHQAIELDKRKDYHGALESARAAVRADPKCQLALIQEAWRCPMSISSRRRLPHTSAQLP